MNMCTLKPVMKTTTRALVPDPTNNKGNNKLKMVLFTGYTCYASGMVKKCFSVALYN